MAEGRDSTEAHDRITELRISGFRVIRNLKLDLHGLTVLIGANGSGKSTVLEALELLRLAASPIAYIPDVVTKRHGGLRSLLRRSADELRLGVTIEGQGPKLDYDLALGFAGNSPVIVSERVDAHTADAAKEPMPVLVRSGSETFRHHDSEGLIRVKAAGRSGAGREDVWLSEQTLALPLLKGVDPVLWRVSEALGRIEHHAPFETRPLWQQMELAANRNGPRWPSAVEPVRRLERYGLNLPSAYQHFKNSGPEVCNRVIDHIRLGLGGDVRDFRLSAIGRGEIDLELILGGAPDSPVPAATLSEGQLAYLGFVALVELNSDRSLLAFDEPELHLHPGLLSRVVWMLEEIAEKVPVVLATHSDNLLDAIADPARCVAILDLDERGSTRMRRPSSKHLDQWLQDYRGFGSIRAEGYESQLFEEPRSSEQGSK